MVISDEQCRNISIMAGTQLLWLVCGCYCRSIVAWVTRVVASTHGTNVGAQMMALATLTAGNTKSVETTLPVKGI